MQSTATMPCPFSDAECQQITRLIRECNDTVCMLQKLSDMGLPVDEFSEKAQHILTFATQLKAAFLTQHP